LCCAIAGTLGFVVGCSGWSDSKPTVSTPTPAQKEQAEQKMKAQLNEMDQKINDLKNRADKATGEEKAKLEAQWKASAGKRAEYEKKFDQFKHAAGNKWEDFKNDAENDYQEFMRRIGQ
jgi:formate-dependent nitrite reductase cytochrome c552 subunit